MFAPNRVVGTDASGNVATSNVTVTELACLTGLTSNLQAQIESITTTRNVGTFNDWNTSNTTLEESTLQFTPQPGRQYVVDARMLIYASNVDHTASLGFKWPAPLANVGVLGILYPSSDVSNTSTLAMAYQTSSLTANPSVNMRLGTLANVPWPVSLRAMFTTANVANISPCAVLANVSSPSRSISLLYGSHLSYRSVPLLPNFPPTITTTLSSNYTLSTLGTPIILSLQAIDPENAPLTWSFNAVGNGNIATVTQDTNVFTITPSLGETYAGSFTVTFTASDGKYSHSKTATFTKPSSSPIISTVLAPTYTLSTAGLATVVTMQATDPENTPLTWSYSTSGMGNIATVSQADNVFTITPSMGETNAGTFTMTFSVTDGTNTTSASTSFTKPSTAPTIANVSSTYTLATNGTATVVTLVASDAESSSLTYSYQVVSGSLGNIASITQNNNVFTITPSLGEANAGSFTLRFGVSDGIYTTYTNNAVFTKPSTAPVIANVASTYTLATTGTATVITLSASDAEGSPLTYAYDVVAGSVGQIASITQNNNVFTVTPSLGETYAGSFTLRFRVSDGVNTAYTNNAVFTKPSTAPTITSSLNASYSLSTTGDATVITITATDPEGTPLTYGYEVVSGAIGSTATIVQDGGTFTITPSTNSANAGSFQLRFRVTDGVNTVYTNGATFSLVFDATPPTITSSLSSSYALATNGTATVITITATDPSGPITYGYQIVSGSLGSTASISQNNNVFTITPSTNTSNGGSFVLQFFARDNFNNTAYTSNATFALTFPAGVLYSTPGTYAWTAPAGVTSVCVVCIGGGGSGGKGQFVGAGGGGGGLGYKNAIAVTPGSSYTVVVGGGGAARLTTSNGMAGGESYFVNVSTVRGGGGGAGNAAITGTGIVNGGAAGTYTGDGGGNGGTGGSQLYASNGGVLNLGGGGAGGYSGAGGNALSQDASFNFVSATNGAGGGGGGSTANGFVDQTGGSGGGVGMYGQGGNGSAGSNGYGGSGGTDGSGHSTSGGSMYSGGAYGGGGGGGSGTAQSIRGGHGAVRIIWGAGRSFPTTNVSLASSGGETTI